MEGIPLLDLKAQFAPIREEIERAVLDVLESQAFILGPVVETFEKDLARFVDVPHAIGCASGTDALVLSLAALGVGPGDTVVTTPFSFFATASCAVRVGATPVFADIDPGTFNIDPEKIESAIGPSTRAILPVHLFGQCADMDAILEIAARRGLAVIEDAAQALGATYRPRADRTPRRAGTLGVVGCYSFFPSKNLGGAGDGGMVVARDDALAARLRSLRVHGETDRYHHRDVGWNSRLDAIQAAVLRVKLRCLDAWSAARRDNARRYDQWLEEAGLVGSGAVALPRFADPSGSIVNQYTIRARDRDRLAGHLRDRGVGHAIYYPVPLHLQPCFRNLSHREGDFPIAEQASREVLSLPVYPELAARDQERVVQALVEFYRGAR